MVKQWRRRGARSKTLQHPNSDAPRWLVIEASEFSIEVCDPLGQREWALTISDDIGCNHLRSHSNFSTRGKPREGDDIDYLHVCELEDLIAELQSLVVLRDAYKEGRVTVGCQHSCVATETINGETTRWCQACGEDPV